MYKGTISYIRDAGDGTHIIDIAPEKPVPHLAGQYVPLSFAGLSARPYSVASVPGNPYLEFHIRASGTGEVSASLPGLKIGDTVKIGAATGDCYWRQDDRPALLLAGGTGIAPMKSILMTHFADKNAVPVRLYWGARSKAHLYLDAMFRLLEKSEKTFNYSPILSDEEANAPYRKGFINDMLKEDFPSLDHVSIYIAGPPMMVQSLYPQLLSMGADPAYIYGDGLPAAA